MTNESKAVRDEGGGALLAALVEAERASMTPPDGPKGETWKRVVGSVAVGTPPPVEPSSILGPASSAATPWLKIVLGVVLSGMVGAGAVVGYRSTTQSQPTVQARSDIDSSAPSSTPPPKPAPPPRAESPAPSEPPAAVAEPDPRPPSEQPRAEVSAPKARAAPSEPDDPPASDLAEETRLLGRARAHLRVGSPSKALAPLAEHARRFPQGQLSEDRMALRAQALCESGDMKAGRAAAAALRKAFSASSHLPRIDRACRP